MTSILPIYDTVFSDNLAKYNVNDFRSTESDLQRPTVKSHPDFTIQDRAEETHRKIGSLILKTIIFPWGVASLLQYGLQRLIMTNLYPAQSNFWKSSTLALNPARLNQIRVWQTNATQDAIFREITIEKNGTRYDGILISHPKTLQNGRWVLQATGNGVPIEHMIYESQRVYSESDFNVLMINGPAVGRSEGQANGYTIGEAQEAGLSFLETAIKAKQIALVGHSLGGAAIGQAILQHEFKKEISYLSITQHTFDRTSNVVKHIIGQRSASLKHIAKSLIHWTDLEMDRVEASKKLSRLTIPEVIIQASNRKVQEKIPPQDVFAEDGIIPAKATLGHRLIKEGVLEHKEFVCLPDGHHLNYAEIFETTNEALLRYFPKNSVSR